MNYCYGTYSLSGGTCSSPSSVNDGNVSGITNNVTTALSEGYAYDQLNRLDSGQTQSTTANGCWGQIFGASGTPEDRWSNLTDMTTTSQCPVGPLDVTAGSSTNQFSGYAYDLAGDMRRVSSGVLGIPTTPPETCSATASCPTPGTRRVK